MVEKANLKTQQEFTDSFRLPHDGFSAPDLFSDAFGFSTSKPRKQNGLDFISLYKIYLDKKVSHTDSVNDNISITAVLSYGEKQEDGSIRLSPTSIPRRANWPLDYVSQDEFYYDIKTGIFHRQGAEIAPAKILKMLEELHLRSTRRWRGLVFRIRVSGQRILYSQTFKGFYYFLRGVLYIASGTRTRKGIWSLSSDRNHIKDKEDSSKRDTFAREQINIFGYHASAWSVVVYALIHLLAYSYWYYTGQKPHPYIHSIFENNFLVITYVIPSLVFFEKIIPLALEKLIEFSRLMFQRAAFRRVELKF